MADQWFYTCQGQRFGPVTLEELRSLIRSRKVQPSDLAWKQGMAGWTAVGGIFELTVDAPQSAPPAGPAPGAPPPGPAMAPPPTMSGLGGGSTEQFLRFLDLGFSHFLTTTIVRWVWALWLVIAPLLAAMSALSFLVALPGLQAVLASVAVVVGYGFATLCVRIWLETIVVIFRMAEHLRELNQKSGKE